MSEDKKELEKTDDSVDVNNSIEKKLNKIESAIGIVKNHKRIVFIIIALIVVAGLIIGIKYYKNKAEVAENTQQVIKVNDNNGPVSEERVIKVDEIKGEIVSIKELGLYKGEFKVTKKVEESKKLFKSLKIPFTTNTITINCTVVVKAGYNLEEIEVEVDNDKKIIHIELPDAKITDKYILNDTLELKEENNILNPIAAHQYETLQTECIEKGVKEAEKQNIYAKTEAHMKNILDKLLEKYEGYDVYY